MRGPQLIARLVNCHAGPMARAFIVASKPYGRAAGMQTSASGRLEDPHSVAAEEPGKEHAKDRCEPAE